MNRSSAGINHTTSWLAVLGLGLILLAAGRPAGAEDRLPDLDAKLVRVSTVEPARDVGYTVGDLLTRTVTLEIRKPYRLVDTSLPIVGYEKRSKGKLTGIELRTLDRQERSTTDSTIYTLKLTYQVFTRHVVAKPAALPAEIVKVESADRQLYALRIPSWSFRISPLAVFGDVKLEDDISPLRGPLLKQDDAFRTTRAVAVGVLACTLLGLLYILGVHAWLPRMGGPFARAYRKLRALRRQPGADTALRLGLQQLHLAFDQTLGRRAFAGNLDQLLLKKPAFAPIRAEIEQFFALSREVFYLRPEAPATLAAHYDWLRRFARHCRDCERGLNPGGRA